MIEILCPKCKTKLRKMTFSNICDACNSNYPIKFGVTCFVDEDKFYEGKFGADIPKRSNIKAILKRIYKRISVFGLRTRHEKHYSQLTEKNDKIIKVLDIGCGGGTASLKCSDRYYVVGLDLSFSSIMNAKDVYDEVFQCSADQTPFADNTFDCVISLDLIGHVPSAQKDALLVEIKRILKPGALSFHYIEVDSAKGYNSWAKKYPYLYKKYFIEQDGHYGLEDYKVVLKRFSSMGFVLIDNRLLAKAILPPSVYSKYFYNEYRSKSIIVNILASFDRLLSSNVLFRATYGLVLKPLEIFVEPLLDDDYGGMLYVEHKKVF